MLLSRRTLGRIALGLLTTSALLCNAEMCEHPTGGVLPLDFNGCDGFTGSCLPWMNATCVHGKCKCSDDQCIMGQQCVTKGSCPSNTGGTCISEDCNSWRNASCSKRSRKCLCEPGSCVVDGECRPPGDCAKSTGGTCKVLPCKGWRHATCSNAGLPTIADKARCICGPDECPINGECVKKGGCPRFTGQTCSLLTILGIGHCSVGQCEFRYCVCPEGQCYSNGQCVMAGDVSLLGDRQGPSTLRDEEIGSQMAVAALVFFASIPLMYWARTSLSTLLRSRQASTTVSDGYDTLEG